MTKWPQLAHNPTNSRLSPIRETFKAVKENAKVANLCIGDPYIRPPAEATRAFIASIEGSGTHYENDAGLPALRECIAELEGEARSASFHPYRNIVITNGGTNGIYSFSRAVLDPGDEVLLPEPIWIPFTEITRLLNCNPVYVPTGFEGNFLPSIKDLEARLTERTKVVVVVSPGNPTGAVYGASKMREICDFCEAHGLWLLHDEAYKDIVFGDSAQSSLVGHSPNAVGVRTVSKSHAMTGARVGWVISSNENLIDRVRLNVAYNVMCVSTPSQHAALAALTQAPDYLERVVWQYRESTMTAFGRLSELGFDLHFPAGSFYLFPRHSYGDRLAERLLEEADVAVVNGARFGPSGRDHFRVACCVAPRVLRDGLDRIERWVSSNPACEAS